MGLRGGCFADHSNPCRVFSPQKWVNIMWTVLSLAVGWCQNYLSASGFSRCAVDKPSMVYVSYKLLFHQSVWHTFVSKIYKNNFWQRISWLPQRWRTQRNAICSVNCRIQWIIESLNAHCAPWYSGEHARFRIINILKGTVWTLGRRRYPFGCEPLCCKAMAWKWLCLQPAFLVRFSQVQQMLAHSLPLEEKRFHGLDLTLNQHTLSVILGSLSDNLVWNRARKPAELKHINKRRKRN